MKHENKVILHGRIGDDYKYLKTQEGKEFATFTLLIQSKFRGADSETMIRIMVFDSNLVKYLHNVNAHQGQWCYINGMITSYKREINGQNTIQNNVYVYDITISKTKENN